MSPTLLPRDSEAMFLRKVERKVEDLEHVAEVGESNETPVILFADVFVLSLTAFLVFLAIALLAYRVA
jgi:hypothetical protein